MAGLHMRCFGMYLYKYSTIRGSSAHVVHQNHGGTQAMDRQMMTPPSREGHALCCMQVHSYEADRADVRLTGQIS